MISFAEKRSLWLAKFIENQALFDGRIRENIETYRKGETTLRVVDENGEALCNTKVKIAQKTHDFGFGSHLFLLGAFESEEKNEEYKKLFRQYFNLATLPFYWDALEPREGEVRFEKSSPYIYRRPAPDACLEYCKENGISHDEVAYVGDDYGMGGNDESVYRSDMNFIKVDNYLDFPEIIKPLLED